MLALFGLLFPVAAQPAASQVYLFQDRGPLVISTTDSLILEWQAPGVELLERPDGSVLVQAAGYSQTNRPGAPRLPFNSILIAVPPGSIPSMDILEIEEEEISLTGALALGEIHQGVHRAPDGQVTGGAFIAAPFELPFPQDPVVLEPVGVLRGVHLARVTFFPVRLEGANLRLTTLVRLAVQFNSPLVPEALSEVEPDPIQEALRSAVANPEQIQPEKTGDRPAFQGISEPEAGLPFAAVEVSQRGLTSLAYEDLVEAGIALAGINPSHLRITRAGNDIPYEWEGDGDGLFEPGERLLFYAEPRDSRWTPVDVYFVSQAQSPVDRMTARSADPSSLPGGSLQVEVLFEQNLVYTPDCFCAPVPAGRDGDRWVWNDLNVPSRPAAQYEFEVGPVADGEPGILTLWLIGYTDTAADPDHRVKVAMNGVDLGELHWDGKQAIAEVLPIPAPALKSGLNTLSLHLPGISGVNVEGVWLDAFSIQFSRAENPAGDRLLFTGEHEARSYKFSLDSARGIRAYDVSDPERPARLSGIKAEDGKTIVLGDPAGLEVRTYFATTEAGILSPERIRESRILNTGTGVSGADYLVIYHPDFLPALSDLVQLRQAQGYRLLLEDVQAIYDVYGQGRLDPAAIHAYLEDAYHRWEIRPVYVLLVGDGTSDPKRYLPSSSMTFIPPFLADVDPWAGETASDNRYVAVEGDDSLPEMLIGRLPVNDLDEAQAVVQKIVRYEAQPAVGSWPGRGLVVADNPDRGGDFPVIAETFLGPLSDSTIQAERLYYEQHEATEVGMRQKIRSAWNEGAGLIIYTGHASIHQWGAEQFLHLEDLSSLQNGNRLPLLLEMTCFTSSFQVPGFATLDESLLRHPKGGAVGAWGSTGLGIATGHATLAESFLAQVLGKNTSIGEAALMAKLELAIQNPDHLDLIDTFTLLGDPGTKMNLSVGKDLFYLPLIQQ
jgi:hypothetical protein